MNHQKNSAKKKPTNFNKTLLPFHLFNIPPKMKNLEGFAGFWDKNILQRWIFKPPTLNGPRS